MSEIIGNLLILAMTVVLFSSIFYFVANMDTPTASTNVDFSGKLSFITGEYCNVTIEHMGGEALSEYATKIYLMTNYSTTQLSISDGGIAAMWTIGTTWYFNTTTIEDLVDLTYSSTLEVLIVDTDSNEIVWQSTLLDGSSGNSAPIIRDRYLAASPLYVRTSYFNDGATIGIFAWVTDAGGDLNKTGSVYADLRDLGGSKNTELTDTNYDNWFSAKSQINVDTSGTYFITITATDAGGRKATSVFSVTVTVSSSNDDNDHSGGGGNGTMPGNLYINQMQGMGIFDYDDWLENEYGANQTTHLDAGEEGIVVVASKFLLNIENANYLYIVDANSKEIVAQASSSAVNFKAYDYYSGYYIYTAMIETDYLEDGGTYVVMVELRDSMLPSNDVFFASETITIGDTTPDVVIKTYFDAACTKECTNFNTTDTIYVKITVKTAGTWVQSAGVVEITDFASNYQVKRVAGQSPQSSNPVSMVNPSSSSSTVFTFNVNLSKANQDPWIPGKNCYMFMYDMFRVGNDKYYLSTILNITAPKIVLDLVSGLSAPNIGWAEGSLINYYKNDNQWVPPDYLVAFPGKHTEGYTSVNIVRIGDLDNDGKNDVIAVLNDYYVMAYMNDGSWTPVSIDEDTGSSRGTITAIEVGYIDADNNLDIVIGYSTSGQVGYFSNDGAWTFHAISTSSINGAVRALASIDLYNTAATQAVATSMSVVVGYTTNGVIIYKNSDKLGTTWTTSTFSGGIPSYTTHTAIGETKVTSYIASGTYATTATNTSYEQLTEVSQVVTISEFPTGISGGNFDVGATASKTVAFGWNKLPSTPFITVYLVGNITWDKKVTGSIKLSVMNGTTDIQSVTYPSTAGASASGTSIISLNLTSKIKSIIDLTSATVVFTDSASNTVHISDLHYLVTYTSANQVFQHTYKFNIGVVGISSTFELYAYTSATSSHDGFIAQYSMDGTTWTSLSGILVNSSTTTHFSSLINQATTASSVIYVRFTDTIRTGDGQNDSLYIKYMYINTKSVTIDPIGTVMDVAVGDMNKDGWEDIVVADSTNVWVLYNKNSVPDGNGITKISNSTAPMSSIKSIGLGTFHGPSKYMDVMVVTSSYIYLINQTSLGHYHLPVKMLTISVNYASSGEVCFAAGDVQGDGYCDFVVSVGTYTYLYINQLGNGTFSKIQVDAAGEAINSIYLGKVRNG